MKNILNQEYWDLVKSKVVQRGHFGLYDLIGSEEIYPPYLIGKWFSYNEEFKKGERKGDYIHFSDFIVREVDENT